MQTLDVEVPFGSKAVVRGMTGHEEVALTDERKVRSGEAVNEVLAACTVSLDGEKPDVKKVLSLRSADRLALMIAIRRLSYGDIVPCTVPCPRCRQSTDYEVDLTMLPWREWDGQEVHEVILPKTESIVRFGYQDGRAEQHLARVKEGLLIEAMLVRVVEVEGIHPNERRKWLLDLPSFDLAELRKAMEEAECGPDTRVRAECPECGAEVMFRVEGQAAFFSPNL